jgi:hypothetical protein
MVNCPKLIHRTRLDIRLPRPEEERTLDNLRLIHAQSYMRRVICSGSTLRARRVIAARLLKHAHMLWDEERTPTSPKRGKNPVHKSGAREPLA